jgi:thiol-disulfide isomerase/thioredoxin
LKEVIQGIINEWNSAKDEEGRNKALAKVDPFLDRAYKLIEENPKDDVAWNALMFTIPTKPAPPEKSMNLLAEHYVDNPKLTQILFPLARHNTPAIQKMLKAAEKSTVKETQAVSVLAQGIQKAEAANEAKAEVGEKLNKEAEEMLVRATKEFGDVKIGNSTIAKMAEKPLFTVRILGIGKTVPSIVSKDLDDKKVELTALRGKVVVLDFWATWCDPCCKSIPHSNELVKKMKDKPFVFVSISRDEKKDTLTDFLKKNEMPWTHWWEGVGESSISHEWGIDGIPAIYVVDAKGVIRHKQIGFDPAATAQNEAFDKMIEDLVKETETKK